MPGELFKRFDICQGFHKHLEEWSKLTNDTTYAKHQESKFGLVNVPEGKKQL